MVSSVDQGMDTQTIIASQQVSQRRIPALERKVDEAIIAKPAVVEIVLSAVQIIDSASLNWLLSVQGRLGDAGDSDAAGGSVAGNGGCAAGHAVGFALYD